jgi:regulator of protease activity HflC (stomatin/prohibitin superfamily)
MSSIPSETIFLLQGNVDPENNFDEVSLDSVVEYSKLKNNDLKVQTENIVRAFNERLNGETFMVESQLYGTRIEPDEFRIVARNNVAELVPWTPVPKRRMKYPLGGSVDEVKIIKQGIPYFQTHGMYIINVPQGRYMRAWFGVVPKLLAEGPHVINAINKIFSVEAGVFDQFSPEINHGSIHIIRVQPGQIAKIQLNNKPHFLYSREQPYVFNSVYFNFLGFVDQFSNYIEHGVARIIRVQPGKVAKIWLDNKPYLLPAKNEPYFFNSPYIKYDGIESLMSEHIQHGTIHIVRVPQGKIAKVWDGQRAQLLSSSEQPYVFNSPYFSLEPNSKNPLINFEDASDNLIVHGPIKRIIPSTNTVAVTYDNGQLCILHPSTNGNPITIISPTHIVEDFLRIDMQTLVFPSERTMARRRSEEKQSNPDEINYEIFRTKDGLPIGVKLLIVYRITDPELALRSLKLDQIVPHIENIVVTDMGRVIQGCSSGDFQNSDQTKVRFLPQDIGYSPLPPSALSPPPPSAPPFILRLQDSVKAQLAGDFREIGIELIRLNFETPKVLDQTVAKSMAENAVQVVQVGAKEAMLEQQFKIAQTQAEQEAKKQEITQRQQNQNLIAVAQAQQQSAMADAKTKEISSQGEANAKLIIAEAQAKAIKIQQDVELNYLRSLSEIMGSNQNVAAYMIAKIQATAVAGIGTTVLSPMDAYGFFGMNKGFFDPKNLLPKVSVPNSSIVYSSSAPTTVTSCIPNIASSTP